jgi:hypothetical protein
MVGPWQLSFCCLAIEVLFAWIRPVIPRARPHLLEFLVWPPAYRKTEAVSTTAGVTPTSDELMHPRLLGFGHAWLWNWPTVPIPNAWAIHSRFRVRSSWDQGRSRAKDRPELGPG